MRILITGAAGMLGTDVARVAELANHEVIPLTHRDLDVLDADAVARRVAAEAPDAVVNCAAYTDVDGAEDDLRGAMDLNAEAAGAVATAAASVGARVVYPSSDYVFDGSSPEPYVESDEPRPLSVYGQSKLAGEHTTAAGNGRHFVVRSSWLFGPAGRNFVDTMLTLAEDHGEVLVVRDQVGCPTYTGHLAEGIVRLLDSDAYGVHHLAASGDCSWYEFAVEIFSQAQVECRVLSCTSDEFERPAPRPPYSVLVSEWPTALALPDWREGLAAYLTRDRGPT